MKPVDTEYGAYMLTKIKTKAMVTYKTIKQCTAFDPKLSKQRCTWKSSVDNFQEYQQFERYIYWAILPIQEWHWVTA